MVPEFHLMDPAGHPPLVAVCISMDPHADLLQIVLARACSCPLPCLLQGRKEHSCQYCDNGDNHKEFDQGEFFAFHIIFSSLLRE